MKNKKPVEITGEYLQRIFLDRGFIENVRRMKRFEDFETGFDMQQLVLEPSFDISSLNLGEGDCLEGITSFSLKNTPSFADSQYDIFRNKRLDYYSLIRVHSHPHGSAMPSFPDEDNGAGDLTTLAMDRVFALDDFGIEIKPIEIIFPLGRRKIELLLVQETDMKIVDSAGLIQKLVGMNKRLVDEYDFDSVGGVLSDFGYKSNIVCFNSRGEYDKESLETIASFSFIPRIVNRNKFAKFLETRLPYDHYDDRTRWEELAD